MSGLVNRKPILTIHIPTKAMIHAETAKCLLAVIFNHTEIGGFQLAEPKWMIGKSNIDMIRSEMVTDWYDASGADDLFLFLDSDQTFDYRDIAGMIELVREGADVVVGNYPRADGTMASLPKDADLYFKREDLRLVYGPTGFMMITRPILERVHAYLKEKYADLAPEARIWMSDHRPKVIPFFLQEIQRSVLGGGVEWAPEDYSFCHMVNRCGGKIWGFDSNTIGHEVYNIRYIPNASIQPQRYSEFKDPKSIVYYTYETAESWNPIKREQHGVGGSETAVIELSEAWTRMGYNVTVYGNIGDSRMVYNGVTYLPYSFFRRGIEYNIVIIWRNPKPIEWNIRCKRLFLDVHDLPHDKRNYGEHVYDKAMIMTKSDYHRSLFDNVPDGRIQVIPNGISRKYTVYRTPSGFDAVIKKPWVIYSSSYDRGLESMIRWGWPYIRREIPDAELHICYGWDSSDCAATKSGDTQHWAFKERMLELFKDIPGIVDHGRVNQDTLMLIKAESMVHYYVGWYAEIDCIAVRESGLVGCIPVVNAIGCFGDANKDYCLKVQQEADDERLIRTQLKASRIIVEILRSSDLCGKLQQDLLNNPVFDTNAIQAEYWDMIAARWKQYFT